MKTDTQDLFSTEYILKNRIIQTVSGSHLYGTNHAQSDWDERGVFIPTQAETLLQLAPEQIKLPQDDIILYRIDKFINLLEAQNPTILEILWAPDDCILYKNEVGDYLFSQKEKLLTSKIKDSYANYAKSQLVKLSNHHNVSSNPYSENPPTVEEFTSTVWYNSKIYEKKQKPTEGFVSKHIGKNLYFLWKDPNPNNSSKSWFDNKGNPVTKSNAELLSLGINTESPELIIHIDILRYKDSFIKWKKYWNWKENRNNARAQLERKNGYDTKHAMHLIRLLKTGLEGLQTGQINVKRADSDYLLSILDGQLSLEDIKKESEKLISQIEIAASKTKLPEAWPDNLKNSLLLNVYHHSWKPKATKKPRP